MPLPSRAEVRPVLLQVLQTLGGRARPRQVYPAVTAHFPQITPADLTALHSDGRTPAGATASSGPAPTSSGRG